MSFNQKPTNLQKIIRKDEMSVQEHNQALDKATKIMQQAILDGNVEAKANEIKSLFYGSDKLSQNDINDIYEMALSIIESEGM